MKKILFLLFSLTLLTSVEAKKIKFAVDMTDYTVPTVGVHLAGDFQKYLGLPKDWIYDVTKLTQDASDPNIYSIVLDLPAFKKYEYKFVNGDQDYQVEFIPVESRVGYGFVTNRWIYLDSLSNDTTFVGAIRFEGNAPKDMNLVRFKVNLNEVAAIDKNSIHVAGSHQSWNPKTTVMYSFGNKIYEIINYVKPGTYEYKYYNGNTVANTETVPSTCAKNGNRFITVSEDIAFDAVCFSDCVNCKITSSNEIYTNENLTIAPNPVQNGFLLQNIAPNSKINVSDVHGRVLLATNISDNSYFVDTQSYEQGIYFISLKNDGQKTNEIGKFVK